MRRRIISGTVLLLCVLLTTALGCAGETQTSNHKPNPTEVRPFSTYGFSFEYPKEFTIWQDGLLDEEADENSGIVQIAPAEGELPLFAVTWVSTWQWGLEGALEAGFAGIENWEGIVSIDKGEVVETTLATRGMLYEMRHRMLYQEYTANTESEDEKVYGVVGGFYCDVTQRAFGLVSMNSGPISSQEVLDSFEAYLDSFVCH
jgi:hypothetical protein